MDLIQIENLTKIYRQGALKSLVRTEWTEKTALNSISFNMAEGESLACKGEFMIRIYFMFKAQYLKTQMEYTVNFWMMILSGIVMRSMMMGVVFVLFRNIPDIAGWQEGEIYLILGFIVISEGFHNLLFEGIWTIPMLVFRGELDVSHVAHYSG